MYGNAIFFLHVQFGLCLPYIVFTQCTFFFRFSLVSLHLTFAFPERWHRQCVSRINS